MSSFILRDLDPTFWARVRAKAAADGVQVKALILRLLTAWLGVIVLALLSTACANGFAAPTPIQPEAPAENLGLPTSLTIGSLPGQGAQAGTSVITAHVQNLHGAPIGNVNVVFATSLGSVSPDVAITRADGTATTTLSAGDTARVSVQAGTLTTSTLIAVNLPPPASTPGVLLNVAASAFTGDPVPFSVSSSAIGVMWSWTFGDGSADQTTAFATTHRYTRAGTYTVTVFGTGTASATATITIAPNPRP